MSAPHRRSSRACTSIRKQEGKMVIEVGATYFVKTADNKCVKAKIKEKRFSFINQEVEYLIQYLPPNQEVEELISRESDSDSSEDEEHRQTIECHEDGLVQNITIEVLEDDINEENGAKSQAGEFQDTEPERRFINVIVYPTPLPPHSSSFTQEVEEDKTATSKPGEEHEADSDDIETKEIALQDPPPLEEMTTPPSLTRNENDDDINEDNGAKGQAGEFQDTEPERRFINVIVDPTPLPPHSSSFTQEVEEEKTATSKPGEEHEANSDDIETKEIALQDPPPLEEMTTPPSLTRNENEDDINEENGAKSQAGEFQDTEPERRFINVIVDPTPLPPHSSSFTQEVEEEKTATSKPGEEHEANSDDIEPDQIALQDPPPLPASSRNENEDDINEDNGAKGQAGEFQDTEPERRFINVIVDPTPLPPHSSSFTQEVEEEKTATSKPGEEHEANSDDIETKEIALQDPPPLEEMTTPPSLTRNENEDDINEENGAKSQAGEFQDTEPERRFINVIVDPTPLPPHSSSFTQEVEEEKTATSKPGEEHEANSDDIEPDQIALQDPPPLPASSRNENEDDINEENGAKSQAGEFQDTEPERRFINVIVDPTPLPPHSSSFTQEVEEEKTATSKPGEEHEANSDDIEPDQIALQDPPPLPASSRNENEGCEIEDSEKTDSGPVKKLEKIKFGSQIIRTKYSNPYPDDYINIKCIYVCEFCLWYMKSAIKFRKHLDKCNKRLIAPPGQRIFESGNLLIHEVDGEKDPSYCQRLCLISRLFIEHKIVWYRVQPFLFYILFVKDQEEYHLAGYFSKAKISKENYNLSCLLVLPPFQKNGYGKLLIGLSYELSKKEGVIGTPESPISNEAMAVYMSYWTHVILKSLEEAGGSATIEDLSKITSIATRDIRKTIKSLNLKIHRSRVKVDQKNLCELIKRFERPRLVVNPHDIMWSPRSWDLWNPSDEVS